MNKKHILVFIISFLCLICAGMLFLPTVQNLIISYGEKLKGEALVDSDYWGLLIKSIAFKIIIVILLVDILIIFLSFICPYIISSFSKSKIKWFELPLNTDSKLLSRKISPRMELNLCLFLVLVIVGIFFTDGLNKIQYQSIGFDEAYNATVAANYMRYGEYRVSYPDNIIFYNLITTGTPVILPTAILFKIFGINAITVAIIPLIYGSASIVLIFLLLSQCYLQNPYRYFLSTILCVILLILSKWFPYISTVLLGESASFFFLLLSLLNLVVFYNSSKKHFMFFAGFFLSAALITKSSMIFFVIVFFARIFIDEYLLKQTAKKDLSIYSIGFIVGFCFFDVFKLITLGIPQYFAWWIKEFSNMISQSTGNVTKEYSIKYRLIYLSEIFDGVPVHFCLFLMSLPIFVYAFYVLTVLSRKEKIKGSIFPMVVAGIGGASLLWYFVLFGDEGLAYARRQCVNGLFIKLFFIYFLGCIFYKWCYFLRIKYLVTKRSFGKIISFTFALYVIFFGFIMQFKNSFNSILSYFQKDHTYSYSEILMTSFIEEVSILPNDATLYCFGWWQEPNITLYLDRKMIDITGVLSGKEHLAEKSYFIVGQYIDIEKGEKFVLEQSMHKKFEKVNKLYVDYKKYDSVFDRKDFDVFSIYAIVDP